LVVLSVPLGVRGARKSDAAINAATTNATVVKKPNVFCILTSDEYMMGEVVEAARPLES
jgi:hypothetical protein